MINMSIERLIYPNHWKLHQYYLTISVNVKTTYIFA